MKKRRVARILVMGALAIAPMAILGRLAAQHDSQLPASPSLGRTAITPLADTSRAGGRGGGQVASITIDYPREGSIFPPEIAAPTFVWRDAAKGATAWRIEVAFSDGAASLVVRSPGERWRIGEIDPRCVAPSNELPKLTPEQAAAHTWKLDQATWEAIKKHSLEHPATLTITGFRSDQSSQPISRGQTHMQTSKDPVGAPIFFRDVPLMPSELEKGVIKPLPSTAVPLVAWRLRYVSEPQSHLLLDGLPVCANCHSFSRDGKTLGMDLDGPQNDKGLYTISSVQAHMSIRNQDVISWTAMRTGPKGNMRIGFMSQVSPDGRFVLTTMRPPSRTVPDNFYVVNFKDYRFLQVFFPTRGGLAWYSRTTGEMHDLPGADDPRYVQTDGVWSPDGKYVVFARAEARAPYPEGKKLAEYANDPNETQIQYDLYRIPFNDGRGGQPEPLAGASQNGMSNTFPKVSPDGRWIVFVKCRNGQLLRPDSRLYIIPAEGGEARRMKCNLPVMNSWHSFSPNGRWLVFSSKSDSPYTQMYLTHLDEEGGDSPAILIEHATAANRAVNIPEFINIPSGALAKIDVPAADFYREFDRAFDLASKGQDEAAVAAWKKALELDPESAKAHNNLGAVLLRVGRLEEGIRQFQKALEVNPQLDEAHNNLGLACWQEGKLDDAIRHMQRALELNPEYAQVYERIISAPEAQSDVSPATLPGAGLSPPQALNKELEEAKKRQQKREKIDAEYRRRLDAVIAYINAASSNSGFEPQLPLLSATGNRSGQEGVFTPADLSQGVRPPGSEIDNLVADLDIPRLWKVAGQKKNSDEVVVAQRQILRIFLRTFETGTNLLRQKKNAQALMCFAIAAQAAPESPNILYSLARAMALNGQDKQALQTLEKAAEEGFNDASRLAGDRAFDGLRDDSGYRKAVAQMRPPGS